MDYSFDMRFCARGMRHDWYRKDVRFFVWNGIRIGLRQRHCYFAKQFRLVRQLWFGFRRFLKHVQPERQLRFF